MLVAVHSKTATLGKGQKVRFVFRKVTIVARWAKYASLRNSKIYITEKEVLLLAVIIV